MKKAFIALLALLGVHHGSALAQCPDIPGREYQYKQYPYHGDVPQKYDFWTIPADPAKRKSINYYETAQRFNKTPPSQLPDFTCRYDGPATNNWGTDRPEFLYYTCTHKGGKVFWNKEYAPFYVINKSNQQVAVDTFTDPRDGLGSNSQRKVSCKSKVVHDTSVFFMRPCKVDPSNHSLYDCGDIINYLGVVRRERVIELIEKTKFEGF